ncbi:MAG TPA: carboxypeptidase regulatory-like domain-containing protein [Acidobacteriaceae bacterium]|nr:carboxypeptidase regulatory-like domain-containing protein [Acidobacteriaceae bacterium]
MTFIPRIRAAVGLPALLIAGLLLWHTPALAQSTGLVSGVVQDTTGAVIPGATVVLTDLDNKSQRETTSNGAGEFSIPGVTAAPRYEVRVEMKGFKTWESQPFPLRPGDQIGFTDIKMQVATATEQVTVEALASQAVKPLDTAERSDVITAKDLDTLAIEGRDATELVEMLPGFSIVSPGVNNQTPNTAVVGMSSPVGNYSGNGAGPTGNDTVIDGVSLTDIDTREGTVQTVNPDMIQDIKVTSSSFSAAYGKGPNVIAATTKAGSSSYHGDAYMYVRDTVLNANDWYNNYLQQSRPPSRYLYPGGQLGGPLWIPDTRFGPHNDKLFFFAAYEYDNQNYSPETLGSWVPTMSERQGDFSLASLNAELCGARPDGKVNLDSVLPMCQTENYLPTGAAISNGNVTAYANPSGVALVNWLPLPNANPFVNQEGYNYIQEVVQTQNGSQFHARLDFNLNDNNKFYATWGRESLISQDPVDIGYVPQYAVEYPGAVTTGDISNIVSGHYTRIFGVSMTNELTGAMSFITDPGNMGNPEGVSRFYMNKYDCTDPGKRAAGTCNDPASDNFSYLGEYKNAGDYSVPTLSDYSSLGYPNLLMPGGFYNNQIRMKKVVPDVADTMNWVKGSHTLSFGVYWEQGILNGDADFGAYPQGEYTFNPENNYFEYNPVGANGNSVGSNAQFTGCENPNPLGTGRSSGASYLGDCMNGVAMMYMGETDSFTQTNFAPIVDMDYTTLSGFGNDSWKIHRVTLMLGARVEHLGPWTDRHNNGLATFSPTLYDKQCSGRNCTTTQAMPGITWHSQNASVANSVNQPSTVFVSPRVGAAWDIFGTGRTVLRGGWGIYREEEQFAPYALAAATAQNYKTSYTFGTETFDLIDNQSPVNPPDFSVYTLSPTDTTRPAFYEFNVTADQRLMWNTLLEVAYVGEQGRNLPSYNVNASGYNGNSDINLIPAGYLFGPVTCGGVVETEPTSCLPLSLKTSSNPADSIGGLDTQQTDFFRPYPFYEHVYSLKHDYYSNYNAMQVAFNKSTGLATWGANYTFSKVLATAASYNNVVPDPLNLRNEYNPAPMDRTGVLSVHYTVNLGRRFTGDNRIFSNLANGWQIAGIDSYQSGPDLPSEEGENFGFGYGSVEPTQVATEWQEPDPEQTQVCTGQYGIPADKNGNQFCVNNLNPTVWLGSPDYQLMPTSAFGCKPSGGTGPHQFINANCFGVPMPGGPTTGPNAGATMNPSGQGTYRLPYIRGPATLIDNLSLIKDFGMGEGKTLELKVDGFNFLNHPLVSFNNDDSSNLSLGNLLYAVPGTRLTEDELGYKDFGIADVKYGSRTVQLSAKYSF